MYCLFTVYNILYSSFFTRCVRNIVCFLCFLDSSMILYFIMHSIVEWFNLFLCIIFYK